MIPAAVLLVELYLLFDDDDASEVRCFNDFWVYIKFDWWCINDEGPKRERERKQN